MAPYMGASPSASGERILAVQRVAVRQTRQGKDFLDLTLADSGGQVTGRKWSVGDPDRALAAGDVIAVRGREETYQGQRQVIVDAWRPATAAEEASASLVPSVPGDARARLERARAAIAAIGHEGLRETCERLYADDEAMMAASAAKAMHSAGRGGLLEHVCALLDMHDALRGRLAGVDDDLLAAGILVHDIGKVRELSVGRTLDYTAEGRLLGHISIGVGMVERAAEGTDVEPDLLAHLLHLVVSHHGQKDYGSPVEPMTATAFALSTLDLLDARLNALAGVEQDGLFFHERLRHFVYKPPGEAEVEAAEPPPDDEPATDRNGGLFEA